MFYLKLFFKTMTEIPVRGPLFLLLSCLLVAYWEARTSVNSWMEQVLEKGESLPYFYALIKSEALTKEHEKILRNMPGIHSFSFAARSEIQEKVFKELSEVFASERESELAVLRKSIAEMDYVGLKVVLQAEGGEMAQQVTYQSIVRLFSAENLILSPIRGKVSAAIKKVGYWPLLLGQYGKIGVPVILCLLWSVALYSFAVHLRRRAYLIEHYARKNLVCFKTLLTGLGTLLLLTSGVLWSVLAPQTKILDMVILVGILFLACGPYLRRWSWNQ